MMLAVLIALVALAFVAFIALAAGKGADDHTTDPAHSRRTSEPL